MAAEKQGHVGEIEHYMCVECGARAEETYKQYSMDIIKLTQCGKCSENVDKYIEYDFVLVLLDILLHKSQAYRHVLFNVKTKSASRLSVLCVLCDTYMKWVTFHHMYLEDFPTPNDWHVILGLQFYVMLGISTMEFLINIFVTASVVLLANKRRKIPRELSFQNIFQILTISSYGKFLAVAALIWNKENSNAYLILTKIFVITSNAEAIKVASMGQFTEALSFVLCGVLTGYLVQDYAVWIVFSTWPI